MPRKVPIEPMTPDELKAARIKLKMTQDEFAEHIRANVKSIKNWEQGIKAIPSWVPNTLTLVGKLRRLQNKAGEHV